ncbi:MAG: hypothetical protein ACO3EK_15165, partial [Alphaproteobacteria bacterium]
EQIWLQLEMASAPVLSRVRRLLKRAGPAPSELLAPGVAARLEQDGALQGFALVGAAATQAAREALAREMRPWPA